MFPRVALLRRMQEALQLAMAETADVIVVGAGMAGASVAAELAETVKVLVIEAEDCPGRHATGRSAALLSETYGNPAIRALTRASLSFFSEPPDGLAVARRRACWRIATVAQKPHLEAFAAVPDVKSAGCWLSGEKLRDALPILNDTVVAAFSEANSFDLDVNALHQFYLKRLSRSGGDLRCSEPVLDIRRERNDWCVETSHRVARAPVVVNAAGAWADEVARQACVPVLGLRPLRRTAVLVDPPPGLSVADWPAVIDIDEQFYFKPEAGQLLLSPADETPSAPCDAAADEIDIATAVARVQAVANLPVNRVRHRWAGLRTFAADRSPVTGYETTSPGFFWLAAQGGYGIQTAPALARLSAALILGRDPPSDVIDQGLALASLAPGRLRDAGRSF